MAFKRALRIANDLLDGAVDRARAWRATGRVLAASGTSGITAEASDYTAPVGEAVHPDTDLIPDSGTHRRRCTLAYANNAIVNGIVQSQARRIVGSLEVQAETPSKRVNDLIEEHYKRLVEEAGMLDKLETLVTHMLVDGGAVPHLLNAPGEDLDFETIPYRLIKTPMNFGREATVRDGFRRDARGRPVSCFVEREQSSYDAVFSTGEYREIPVIGHPALPRLAGQTKALPWYSSAVVKLEMVNRWMEALLRTAELHAHVVFLVQSAAKDARGLATSEPTKLSEDQERNLLKFAQKHRMAYLPNGGDWKLVQANAPQIAEFLVWCLRFIARALGVSFERLTYDLTHTSFSSTKFGDRDDQFTVLRHQRILTNQVLRPLHRELVAGLFLTDEALPGAGRFAADPASFLKARFQLPGKPPVDESKAEQANEMAIANRTASRTSIMAERGKSIEDLHDEIMREDTDYFDKRFAFYKGLGFEEEEARDNALEDLRGAKSAAPAPVSGATGSAAAGGLASAEADEDEETDAADTLEGAAA